MFTHRYRYLFIFLISLYTLINTLLCDVYGHFDIAISWYAAFLIITSVTLLCWEGNRIIYSVLSRDRSRKSQSKIRYLIIFFIGGNIISIIAASAVVLLTSRLLMQNSWLNTVEPLKLNIIYAGLINLFFHLLHAIWFFFHEYQKKVKETEELKQISSQAQIQLIKSQVNPHFLFNNLNVLSGMLMKDNPEANEFIEEFSKVYRYILLNQEKELVDLRSELNFIRPYIFLLQKRFPGGLDVRIDIPDRYNSHFVIPVALQMLIENAIKHNVVSNKRPLFIEVYTNGNGSLHIKNNLQPKQTITHSTHIGLRNIIKRYELVSGRAVIVNRTEMEFEVVLPLLHLN